MIFFYTFQMEIVMTEFAQEVKNLQNAYADKLKYE